MPARSTSGRRRIERALAGEVPLADLSAEEGVTTVGRDRLTGLGPATMP